MFKINAGKYRHVATLQKLSTIRSPYGGIDRNNDANWDDIATIRIAIFPISGKDVLTAEYVKSEITHRIAIRYNPELTITSDMRINFNGRVFDIISPPIDFQEKNMELQLMCKERGWK